MSPFLICLSPPDRQIRQTNGRIRQTDRRMVRGTGRMDWSNGQTEGLVGWTDELDGQTDKLNKQTLRYIEGRTDVRMDGRRDKRTGWTRWTDGRT